MSGLLELITTVGFVGLVWAAGAAFIKGAEALDLRRAAPRHAARVHRRRP